jgi:NADH-quinone oxidoreductase subunit L
MISEYPPGLLFVVATLVPLASFVLLLIWGGLRWVLRPYAEQRDPGPAAPIFHALGGYGGGRAPAIVATVAIALAFILCATGFVLFYVEDHEFESTHKKLHSEISQLEGMAKANPGQQRKFNKQIHEKHHELEDKEELFNERWSGRVLWAGILPRPQAVAHEADHAQGNHGHDHDHGPGYDAGKGTMLYVGFRIDMLSALMFVMVSLVSTLIHLFSIGYMSDELQPVVEDHEVHGEGGHYRRRGRFGRFFMFLSLFCFSMLNLILADNLFQIFVSWELVGICSFLLIGFYFERTTAANAANKAFITNRIGDAGFLIGLMIVWTYVGTFNFEELFARLRAPERDAHHALLHKHRVVTADRGTPVPGGYEMNVKPIFDTLGSDVIVFPRNQEHIHFGEASPDPSPWEHIKIEAYDSPGATDFGYMPYWTLVLAGLGIFLGCVGKSAQFPLQVWLPDAMEGPTPVSALIHAATMVAAGVYLVARVYPVFVPEVLLVIAYTGAITLFVAATIAVVMTDIKKVLAYSTVSQLGYMMLGLGVGGWVAGSFHLITHAFFKALLFLCSGSVIYGCHHQQDMLKMGGLYPKMKITALTMLVGVLAICGVPLFAGWYSKDAILVSALAYSSFYKQHTLLFVLPLITAGLTTFYMFRMWFMTFTGQPRDAHVFEHAHESPWTITVPLIVLAAFSIFVAWGLPPWDAHESHLAKQLEHSMPAAVEADFDKKVVDEDYIKRAGYHETAGALALLMVVLGVSFAGAMYYKNLLDPADTKEQFPGVHRFLSHKWWFDEFYSAAIVRPGLVIAGWARAFDTYVIDGFIHLVARCGVGASRWSGNIDRGIVDGLVNVLANVWYGIGSWLRTFQTGYLRSYVLFLALAAIAIWFLLVSLWGVAVGGP